MDILFFTLCTCLFNYLGESTNQVIVSTENGPVRGEKKTGEEGNVWYSFRGIPYAKPPVGELRFKPPVTKERWADILEVQKDGPSCPQKDRTGNIIGSEDCLYLNVYTTQINKERNTNKKPVVFHIHGGGFSFGHGGSPLYGAEYLPLDEIVFVTINYRLGSLGYLSTEDSSSPGNYGLLDQTAALQWVQRNIEWFGGNSQQIILFGQSSGGVCVIYHMLSPLSQGLFQRAIALSGTPLFSYAFQKEPTYWATTLATKVSCEAGSSNEMINCLRQKTAEELVNNTESGQFAPSIDGYFISDSPLNILKAKKYSKDVPVFIGATKEEAYCRNISQEMTEEKILEDLKFAVDVRPNVTETVIKIKDAYFTEAASYETKEAHRLVGKAITDGLHESIFQTVEYMTEGETKVYVYSYDYNSRILSANKSDDSSYLGVCHSDDIFLLLSKADEKSQAMKKSYLNLLLNFIKQGNPTPEIYDLQCKWPLSKPHEFYIYHINSECSVEKYDDREDDLFNFWNKEIFQIS